MSEPVRAVERALDVLLSFSVDTPSLTLTQIAGRVGVHKSTAHRLLATLEHKGFVRRDPPTGSYQLGLRLLQMAYLTLEQNDLRRLASPFMRHLNELHRETVDITVLDGTDVVFLDVVESPQRVKLAASPGMRAPAFATASGKAILAFMDETKAREILDRGMPRFTPATPRSRDAYMAGLKTVRERGFAVSEQEYEEGINAVSAAILESDGRPMAAIAVAGPAFRLTREVMVAIGPDVVAAAEGVAREVAMTVHSDRSPANPARVADGSGR